jgi:predicted SAM-dependent methyltransferase
MSLKQQVGRRVIPALGVNGRTFGMLRFEVNAAITRVVGRMSPRARRARRAIAGQSHLKVNVGSGGEGSAGWINIDIGRHHRDQTLAWDIRRSLPFADGQVAMIRAEHVVEHLEFREDIPRFFAEARRVLEPGGHLRIVVPDGERWVRAYASGDQREWNALGCTRLPDDMPSRMSMLNHVFHQGGEHQFAWDFETMEYALRRAGFEKIYKRAFGESGVNELASDLERHALYSLYVEAVK